MKSIYLGLALLAAMGCSDDAGIILENPESSTHARLADETITPENPKNPYDSAGMVHNQLILAYYDAYGIAGSSGLATQISFIASEIIEFSELDGPSYDTVDLQQVASINASIDPIGDVLSSSGISAQAVETLESFLIDFQDSYQKNLDYSSYYWLIADYEDALSGDLTIEKGDKKVLLTVTSLMRHAAYLQRKKPKKNEDPDWILMTGSIAAAIEGAGHGTQKSVIMAAASGILHNF